MNKTTMPTREEIFDYLDNGTDGDREVMLRRIADALKDSVVVPKEPFGYIGWREQKHMVEQGRCSISRKAFPELDCDTPVYMLAAAQGKDHE